MSGLGLTFRRYYGLPFGCGNALYGLTRLAVWWLRLGIHLERIKPGHPEQNGRHERMHLTLKQETTRPPGQNTLQQQARFDAFVARYNDERPHEALAMRVPADDYRRSPRPYRGLTELEYPFHDWTAIVTTCGRTVLKVSTKASNRACWLRLLAAAGRVVSCFSVRCMRS